MITSYQATRIDDATVVTVISSLAAPVYYHWYLDGMYAGATGTPQRTFQLPVGDQARVEVLDTNDADFDPIANAPAGWPARRLLWWVKSLDPSLNHYKVQQQQDGGEWETLAVIRCTAGRWTCEQASERLDDLSIYTWRIVPIDAAGNEGTPLVIGPEKIVRTPDAPAFTIEFDPETSRVTFDE